MSAVRETWLAKKQRPFDKKSQGDKGAEFADCFGINTRTRQILRNICQLHVFFMGKGVQEYRDPGKKVIFLLTNRVSGLWFR